MRYFGPYKISGYIRQLNESPLEGARVRAGSSYAMTDSKGYYQLIQLQEWKYTVEAELDGYSFYPEKQAISLPPSARDVNFTARIANGMNMVVYQPVVIGP